VAVLTLHYSVHAPLLWDARLYSREAGGHEGSILMAAAFAVLFKRFLGEDGAAYVDDAIITPSGFDQFRNDCAKANLRVNLAKTKAVNCCINVDGVEQMVLAHDPKLRLLGVSPGGFMSKTETRLNRILDVRRNNTDAKVATHTLWTALVNMTESMRFDMQCVVPLAAERIFDTLKAD